MESSLITSVHSMNPMGIGTGLAPNKKVHRLPTAKIARAIRLISKEFVNNQIDTQILVNESSELSLYVRYSHD